MLSIDRRILEKISIDNEMNDSFASKSNSPIIIDNAGRLRCKPIEVKQTPQNEMYMNNALRA